MNRGALVSQERALPTHNFSAGAIWHVGGTEKAPPCCRSDVWKHFGFLSQKMEAVRRQKLCGCCWRIVNDSTSTTNVMQRVR